MKALLKRLTESALSVLPVTLIILILYFTPLVTLTGGELLVFIISAVFLILGICLFGIGADLSMTPMGDHIGAGLTKSKKLFLLLSVCFIMGLLVTIAEPDLSVLASQVERNINRTALIVSVGVGVGLFLLLAVLKIVTKASLSMLLYFFYMVLFALCALLTVSGKGEFLAIALDSGGVTTGPITVPFIMALGVGIANTIGGRNSKENSFGLVSLCSVGPILAVLVLGLTLNGNVIFEDPDYSIGDSMLSVTLSTLAENAKSVGISLGLIVLFFVVLQSVLLKLPKKRIKTVAVGTVYTYVGLVLFLTSATIGFMPIGYKVGKMISAYSTTAVVVLGFVMGATVVLAEPAVHVLNKQVEWITGGGVTKRSMTIALCVGVGVAIGLSVIRIVFDFSILYYVVPGYIISLGLSFFVPRLYTAIAFDSGGVASGPLTSSFILPFAIGACVALQGAESIPVDAFGIVAMVAMAPLIAIQFLGFKSIMSSRIKSKIAMKKILDDKDEQIISFT